MRKLLKTQDSIIDVFTGYSCTIPLFINETEGKKWFIQNYLNYMTTYDEKYTHMVSDYFYCDFTYNSAINFYQPENIINLPYTCYSTPTLLVNNIIDFIKDKINYDFYVCLHVNLKYLNEYHLKNDIIHDLFIYGYDDEKQLLYSSGYKIGKKYALYEYNYDEFLLAYKNHNIGSLTNLCFDTERISYFKYKKNFKYDFTPQKFSKVLKEYLNFSTNYTSISRYVCYGNDKDNECTAYGIKCIEVLIKYIENITINKKLDIRQVYFLYNHKINMHYKIKYLIDNNYINNSILIKYENIVCTAKICLNFSIKYSIKPQKIYLKKMILCLKKIYEEEKRIFIEILESLEILEQ